MAAAATGMSNQRALTPPMDKLLDELRLLASNPAVEAAYNDAIAHVTPLIEDGSRNPWLGQSIDYFIQYFHDWFTFLPEPSGGLGKIVPFTYFYLDNSTAQRFLNTFKSRSNSAKEYTTEIFDWTVKFIKERGRFMDSPESLQYIEEWIKSPATHIDAFLVPPGGFKSFNEFFTRQLNPARKPRPIADPDDDSVVVAPADSIINFILSDLTLAEELEVKSRQLNITQLLNHSDYARYFAGGTAVSCVLMPQNYHHFHSPVSGQIVESMEVPGMYNGIIDGEDWFNTIFNVGESTTNFSVFEDFHRSYYVIKTEKYGYVGLVPVGLNTISSIHASVIHNKSTMVPKGAPPVPIKKGDELGHFAYGGSLNILLFQKGAFDSVSVLMGTRLGTLSEPS